MKFLKRMKERLEKMTDIKEHNRWLYLPMETKVRELDAKLLLAFYAVHSNYRVVLGLSGMMEEALEHLPAGIFLDKGYTNKDKLRRFQLAEKYGHKVLNLHEEGFPLTEKEIYIQKNLDQKSFNLLDYECCWGEVQKNIIVSEYPGEADKCVITGNPRFDLLQTKYRSLFNSGAEAIKKRYGDFILINTRFPAYTKTVNEKGRVNLKVLSQLEKHLGKYGPREIAQLYKKFIVMVKACSQRYPHLHFVIRPHPSEVFSVYEQDLRGCENVSVVHEGNVINWILASKLVIHNGCTTGAEAFLLEKPVISYIPIKERKYDLPNELSIKVAKVKDLFHFLDHNLNQYDFNNNKYNEQKKLQLLKAYSAGVQGQFAYENILQLLNRIPAATSNPGHIEMNNKLVSKLKREGKKSIYHTNPIVMQKFPSLSTEEIKNFLTKINRIERKGKRIVVRKLHDKFIELTLEA